MVGLVLISQELGHRLLFPGIWIAGLLGKAFQFGVHDSALCFVSFAADVLFNSVCVFLGIRLWPSLKRNRDRVSVYRRLQSGKEYLLFLRPCATLPFAVFNRGPTCGFRYDVLSCDERQRDDEGDASGEKRGSARVNRVVSSTLRYVPGQVPGAFPGAVFRFGPSRWSQRPSFLLSSTEV